MLDIRKVSTALSLGLAFLGLLMGNVSAAVLADDREQTLQYDVDLSDTRNHYLTISVDVPVKDKTTELMMAVWTPGSYLVREYARNIDSMEVSANGKPLEYEKVRKNRWLVQTDGIKSFQVKYRLYCNEMSVRTNWVGQQYAMINGAPTYLTVPDRLDQPHIIRLSLPKGWTRSATSLRATGETPHTFVAEDFDELVDSPIVAGNVSVYPFSVGGVEHQLVNVGESGYWDGTKAATDLKKVVQAHQDMWGVVPYDRYLFLNMIVESGGGLEHDNSTVLMTSRWSFRESGRYKSWLSLASHEFFHTWNIRRLKPKSLIEYDYENEVYTDSLWIAEGITSYYQDLALVRAGLNSRSEFISKLSRQVEGVQRTGGRKLQSLKDSSYDAWIKYYRPDENSSNTRISYYTKGAVVAFLLDVKIRKLTNGKKSLDDLMRKMFDEYLESGYTTQEFRNAASEIAGEDLSDWFATAIDSTDELDFGDIDAVGLVVPNKKPEPKPTVDSSAKENKDGEPEEAVEEKEVAKKTDAAKKLAAAKLKAAARKKAAVAKRKAAVQDAAKKKKSAKKDADKKDADKKDAKATAERRAERRARQRKKSAKAKQDRKSNQDDAIAKTSDESRSKPAKSKKAGEKAASAASPVAEAKRRAEPVARETSGWASRFGSRASSTRGGRPWLGFSSSASNGKVTVSGVKPGSPAWDVGLNNDDEVIAVDGFRVTSSVDSRLSQYKVGEEIDVLIARRGKLMTLRMTIGERVSESWRIRLESRPSDEQKRQLDLWLGGGK